MHDRDDAQIAAINNRAIVHLKSWALDCSDSFSLPPGLEGHGRLLTLAPGEWLLTSDSHSAQTLFEHTRSTHERIAAVIISAALGTLKLEGNGVRNILSKHCGLDVHRAGFPLGSCARTRLANLPVIVDYVDAKPSFDLYVGSSHLSYLQGCLNDAL